MIGKSLIEYKYRLKRSKQKMHPLARKQKRNEGRFYRIMVGSWGVAGHCSAFTGAHKLPDTLSEQGADSYDYSVRRRWKR
jgi:hypothetical protein